MRLGSCFSSCFHPSTDTLVKKRSEEEKQENEGWSQTISNPNLRVFSYEELKASTQGFKNKIGQGGTGSVFKGRLGLGRGELIAVKVVSLEMESMRGEREFISEIAALCDIKHENLVSLKGCCIHEAQRLLVYDYMENNSLSQTLLGAEQNRMKFSWELRKNVALGIARGLRHLHEEVVPRIVHRDIKASNILLDHNFTPKISDFGLAKLFRDNNTSHISTRVAGTLGYISPEYAHSGHLTRKSDVYSFGVLLLEIISGLPVVDYHLQHGEQFLVDKAWELYQGNKLLELVDSVLEDDFPQEEAVRFLKIGLFCVQETTKLRPTMSTAIKMLNNEIDVENTELSRPGILADLMDVKIRRKHSSNFFSSSPASSSTCSPYAR